MIEITKDPQNTQDVFEGEVKRWFSDMGDTYRRLDYPSMDKNSIVFDLGGYIGNFTESIYTRYNCNVFVFEPVKKFYDVCSFKFKNNKKIKVFNFGLSGSSNDLNINVNGDISTVFDVIGNSDTQIIKLNSIKDFVVNNKISCIDLLKINIEGGEYELLEYLVSDIEVLSIIKNIQVQYHTFVDDHFRRRNEINDALSKTHHRSWNYDWVWENWEIKK